MRSPLSGPSTLPCKCTRKLSLKFLSSSGDVMAQTHPWSLPYRYGLSQRASTAASARIFTPSIHQSTNPPSSQSINPPRPRLPTHIHDHPRATKAVRARDYPRAAFAAGDEAADEGFGEGAGGVGGVGGVIVHG